MGRPVYTITQICYEKIGNVGEVWLCVQAEDCLYNRDRILFNEVVLTEGRHGININGCSIGTLSRYIKLNKKSE
jgi:hypothetical protein